MTNINNPPRQTKQIQEKHSFIEADQTNKNKKIEALNKFSELVFRKVHHILFMLLILVFFLYSFPMMVLNYLSSVNSQGINGLILKPSNQFSLSLLKFSNFSTIYHSESNLYIQDFILIGTLILLFIVLVLTQAWLKQIRNTYKDETSLIENYCLQITLKNKVKKKSLLEFTEYFTSYTARCLRQKIYDLTHETNKSSNKQFQISLLTQIQSKLTLIQQIIFVPYRIKVVVEDLLDVREEQSNMIIAIFSYQQVAQTVFQWWKKKNNMENVKSFVLEVTEAPSPKNLLLDKLKNKSTYKNKVCKYSTYVFLSILWEISFLILLSGLVYIHSMPSYMFSLNFKESASTYFCHGMLVIEAFVMFLYNRLFHQSFLPNYLVQSKPNIITFQKQAQITISLNTVTMILNFIIIPFGTFFIVSLSSSQYNLQKTKFIIESSLFGQFGMITFLIYYAIITHVIVPSIEWLSRCFRKCINNRPQDEPVQKIRELVLFQGLFLEFSILLGWSILCSPVLAFVTLFGIALNLEEFCSIKQFDKKCFVAITFYLESLLKYVKYFFICLTCAFANSLLNGYIMAVDQTQPLYPLLISFGSSILILSLTIFFQNIHMKTLARWSICIFGNLPKEIVFKKNQNSKNNHNQEQKLTTKNNQVTSTMIQKIYGNQFFLFTYDEQFQQNRLLYKNSNLQINKKDQTKKVIQQLNTMSRSLEQTLKQRLLTKSTHPFEISPISKQQESEYSGIIYEDKVQMKPKKRNSIYIPLLFIPDKHKHQTQQKIKPFERKATDQLQRTKTDDYKSKLKVKRSYACYNMAGNQTNRYGQGNNGIDSDMQYYFPGKQHQNSKLNSPKNEKAQKNFKNTSQIAEQLLKRKIKFTDLFDSQEESIKNLVKKKIRQSIPKIRH